MSYVRIFFLAVVTFITWTAGQKIEQSDFTASTPEYATSTPVNLPPGPGFEMQTWLLVVIIVVPTICVTACCIICTVFCFKCAKLKMMWRFAEFRKNGGDLHENGLSMHETMERIRETKKLKKAEKWKKLGQACEEEMEAFYRHQSFSVQNQYMDIEAMAKNSKRDKWEISEKNLLVHENDCLGNGAFASVYKGTLRGQIPLLTVYASMQLALEHKKKDSCEVAVKRIPPHASHENRADFFHEMTFMKTLGYHVHVISRLGCVSNPNNPLIVVEYCQRGDLLKFIRKNKNSILGPGEEDCPVDGDVCLKIKDLVSLAWQISDGMCYLSSHKFIHRDVAARNVLLTNQLSAKISDFGLCRYVDSSLYTAKGGRLPIKWMAPESLKYYEYTVKTDIWAYSVLLFELFSLGEAPYQYVQPMEMIKYLEEGNRMKQPLKCPNEIFTLMKQCWEFKSEDRPTFEQIRSQLTLMLNFADNEYGYLDLKEETSATPTHLTFLTDECPIDEFLTTRTVTTSSIAENAQEIDHTARTIEDKLEEKRRSRSQTGKGSKGKITVDVEIDETNNVAILDRDFFEKFRQWTADCDDIQINVKNSRPPSPDTSKRIAETADSESDDEQPNSSSPVYPTVSQTVASVHHSPETSSAGSDIRANENEERSYQNVRTMNAKPDETVHANHMETEEKEGPVVELLNQCALRLLAVNTLENAPRVLEPCFEGTASHTPVYYQNPNEKSSVLGLGRHEDESVVNESNSIPDQFSIEDEEDMDSFQNSQPFPNFRKPIKKQLHSIDSFTV